MPSLFPPVFYFAAYARSLQEACAWDDSNIRSSCYQQAALPTRPQALGTGIPGGIPVRLTDVVLQRCDSPRRKTVYN